MSRRWAAALVLTLGAGCLGELPRMRYYDLRTENIEPQNNGARLVLGVAPFEVDPTYDDVRMVYRTSPYQIDYYEYHQWSAPPGLLVQSYFQRALQETRLFERVVSAPNPNAEGTLSGRIEALEEVDISDERWVGRVQLELELRDAEGETQWAMRFQEQREVEPRSPAGLARAISAALANIVQRAAPKIASASNTYLPSRDAPLKPEPRAGTSD